MAVRNLFLANSLLAVLECAAAARRQGGRAQLVLVEDFGLAERVEKLLRRWRDNPFEQVVRVPGRHEGHRRGSHSRGGILSYLRRVLARRESRRQALETLRALDARFEPELVWTCDDTRLEMQYALHLASERTGTRAGRWLDNGLHSYLRHSHRRSLGQRIDELARRAGYGRWAKRVKRAGTSPWIAEAWLAFPEEAIDQSPERRRQALPQAWFAGRDFLRLAVLSAREFGVGRQQLRGCSAVLVLPHSKHLRRRLELLLRLRRLLEALEACGRRVALKYHPRETEPDPGNLAAEAQALQLPKAIPLELLLPLLPRGALLVGDAGSALLAARWARPDLAVREFGRGRGDRAGRARTLLERHGIEALDETAPAAGATG